MPAPTLLRGLLILCLALTLTTYPTAPALLAQADSATQGDTPYLAEDLAFRQIVTIGQNGFTEALSPQGIAGRVVFGGTRNGARGLFLYDEGSFVEVLLENSALPNGLGTATPFLGSGRMLPNGDVLLTASVSGGSLPAGNYLLRWRDGVFTVQQYPGRMLDSFTSDGRWLVEEQTTTPPLGGYNYYLSDGTTSTLLVSLVDQESDCFITRVKAHAANAARVVVISEFKLQKSVCALGGPGLQTEWTIRLGGAINQTVLSGGYFTPFGTANQTGENIDLLGILLNDANQLVANLTTRVSGTITRSRVVVLEAGGIKRVLFDTAAPTDPAVVESYGRLVKTFDAQERITASPKLGSNDGPRALLRGNSLPADVVIQEGDPLFDSTLLLLQPSFSAFADPSISGENRGFYFTYELANGVKGIGFAGKTVSQWANASGGSWGTASDWQPIGVPGPTDNVAFDLARTYAVTLDTHTVGGVGVSQGDVTWRNGTLTVTPQNLAVADTTGSVTPRLTIGAAGGSATTVNANVLVGPGDLRVENANVQTPDLVELGALGPATVTVTGGARWGWPAMQIGGLHPARLRVAGGAIMGDSPAEELIIGAGGAPANHQSTVIVDGAGGDPGPSGLGTTLGASIQQLVIGQASLGSLAVINGGSAFAVTTTVGTQDHGSRTDGTLEVRGGNAARPSRLDTGNDFANHGGLFAATVAGTDALLEVTDGGLVQATLLSLASAPQSNALMFVDGVNGARRSSLLAPLPDANDAGAPNPAAGLCVVGQGGRGTLNVSNGGLVECRNLAIGYDPGSRGELNIGGAMGQVVSQVIARATATGGGLVCIGSTPACGAAGTGARGEVTLFSGGLLEGEAVLVGSGGRIRGSGTILALEGMALVGGSLAPGITLLEPTQQATVAQRAAATVRHTPGTLTIQGNVTVNPTGVITLHVHGATADLQDRLVVSGTLTLDGELALNFGEGYAPQEGDTLALIEATNVVGSPQSVVITGLAAGFEYDLVTSGGVVQVTALNDGVPTTRVTRLLFLPNVSR